MPWKVSPCCMIEDMRCSSGLYELPASKQTDAWDTPPSSSGSNHGRGSVVLTAVASRLSYVQHCSQHSGHPHGPMGAEYLPQPSGPITPYHAMVGPLRRTLGRGCTPAPHPPVACAFAASKRSSCARRPSSRLVARSSVFARAHGDDRRRDSRKDREHDGHTSRAAARSPTTRCYSTAQSMPRRLVRQAPRTASLAQSHAHHWVTRMRPTRKTRTHARTDTRSDRRLLVVTVPTKVP
jgi:hypothetical protein